MRSALLLLVATSVLGQGAVPPPPPPPPAQTVAVNTPRYDILIVSGTGSVEMAPDVVSFNVGVETSGKDVRKIV
ncbi:MAG: hypothetical protein JOZ54_04635, partial [Acidobacteria bacterium]|nr:hypothetical protein [Acidobacteriota bacterium]